MMSDKDRKRLMEKRRKLKPKEWYSTEHLLEKPANWFFLFGQRSNGKSFALKFEILLKEAFEHMEEPDGANKHRFFYVRRLKEQVKPEAVLEWLSDMTTIPEGWKKSPIQVLSDGRYNCFIARQGKIYAANRDENGELTEDKYHIGYYISVGDAENVKSRSYLDVNNIAFEEFIATTKPYLSNEPTKFNSLVSTITRRRKDDIKIFFIGNNDDRDCIYFRHYGLSNVKKQKEGTIDRYEKLQGYDEETGEPIYINVVVEFAPNNKVMGEGVEFGKAIHETSGEWKSLPQPTLEDDYVKKCDEIYRIYVEYHELKYLCILLLSDKEDAYFWYVKPYNKTIPAGSRVVAEQSTLDPMSTTGFIPLFKAEEKFFYLMEIGKVFFCDNLTGTEFKRAYKDFTLGNFYEGED